MPQQSLELCLPKPIPAVYTSEAELTESLDRKGTPEPGSGLYPRDGTETVTEVEDAIAELTIPDQRLNVVVSSGMAAVSGAIRFALSTAGEGRRDTDPTPTLAHSIELYSQSTQSIRNIRNLGARTLPFRLSQGDTLGQVLDKAPSVVFAETVSNSPAMPVLDIHKVLKSTREAGKDGPILVLDNTLPLSTGVNFEELLEPTDRVIVVESATKGVMHNAGHLGVVYSKNEELIDGFRKFKATEGIVTSTQADSAILDIVAATRPSFHERNRALYGSTGKIAVALAEAQQTLGDNTDFTVSFPEFSDHPDQPYVQEHMPNGVSPVVFMVATRFDELGSRDLLKRISEHKRMREQIKEGQIYLSQSFGFPQARLLYDRDAPNVRIAGGYDIDSESLANALLEAVADK